MHLDNTEITGIVYDSRKVKPGNLFVAIPGTKVDGAKYIKQAIENGAIAVAAETEFEAPKHIKKIIIPSSRKYLAEKAAEFYNHPCQKLKIIGVTGTNGKTTTTYLIKSILDEAGFKTLTIGTIDTPTGLTTPESLDLQKLLAEAVKNGITHVVMEVSSHALALDRVHACEFDIAIFTNLTHDHLDFHKSMEEYLAAKKKLFTNLGTGFKKDTYAVINIDDKASNNIIESIEKAEIVPYGLEQAKRELGKEIRSNLPGQYNNYNTLAAIECAKILEISRQTIKTGIEKLKTVPGRFELIDCGQLFKVIVDFAHTPDALEKLLTTTQSFKSAESKIILVFGCPGDRDKEKRPIMGQIAAKLADLVIITTDDPHSEQPDNIIKEIAAGLPENPKIEKTVDRKQAIENALGLAKPHDIVILAGRGHEKHQDFNGKKVAIDDREVARLFLRQINKG